MVLSRQVEPGQTVAASFNVATLFTIAQDLSRMKLQVKVDEADVGELHAGAPATFTVDAYPDRTFPATVTRVDLGANATPIVNSAGTDADGHDQGRRLYRRAGGRESGRTAEARHDRNGDASSPIRSKTCCSCPTPRLRFTPPTLTAAEEEHLRPAAGAAEECRRVARARASSSGCVGADGKPKAIPVTVGHTNGSLTEVTGPGLHPGLQVITGQLAGTGK